jgi:2-haloacid dehalogenase
MKQANLQEYFERNLSVETVRRYKPAPEPYLMAATALGVSINRIRMIAAHAWDVGGAMQAGCAAAFVARPGKALFRLLPRPDIIGGDLVEVADAILKVELSGALPLPGAAGSGTEPAREIANGRQPSARNFES